MPWGVVSASSPVNTPTGYGTAMCRLHEWNSSREWKNDGWQKLELKGLTLVPQWFQIEAPKENRSHKHEKKKRKAGYKK
jgi:hypothetical protein